MAAWCSFRRWRPPSAVPWLLWQPLAPGCTEGRASPGVPHRSESHLTPPRCRDNKYLTPEHRAGPGLLPAPRRHIQGGRLAGCWRRRTSRAGRRPGFCGLLPQPLHRAGPACQTRPPVAWQATGLSHTLEKIWEVCLITEGPVQGPLCCPHPAPALEGLAGELPPGFGPELQPRAL